jgi:hypothetical protein
LVGILPGALRFVATHFSCTTCRKRTFAERANDASTAALKLKKAKRKITVQSRDLLQAVSNDKKVGDSTIIALQARAQEAAKNVRSLFDSVTTDSAAHLDVVRKAKTNGMASLSRSVNSLCQDSERARAKQLMLMASMFE